MLRGHAICIWKGNEEGRTDGYRHGFDTTEVLDFASHLWVSMFIYRHVHVTPERALRHMVGRGGSVDNVLASSVLLLLASAAQCMTWRA